MISILNTLYVLSIQLPAWLYALCFFGYWMLTAMLCAITLFA